MLDRWRWYTLRKLEASADQRHHRPFPLQLLVQGISA